MENQIEIWKTIQEFNTYEVSNLGNVRNKKKPQKNLKPKNNKGYLVISLCSYKIKKSRLIHRLVAITFIPNPENKKTVNHKNSIKTDNKIDNLEWCTHSENNLHAYAYGFQIRKYGEKSNVSKLTEKEVLEIREIGKTTSLKNIAKKYNVSVSNIWFVLNNKTWNHI